MRIVTIIAATVILTGAALAHTGVKNPAVQARMNSMSEIGAGVKTLGEMTKGQTAFDRDTARAAAAKIAKHAAETPALFKAQEDDPKSEAKSVIWENYADFTAKSDQLVTLALELSQSISTQNDLAPAMQALGASCQACHKPYRE